MNRPPSPPLLSRSLTRGGNAPRQPIDDDDDFLTPMDTLPNTHRMDDFHGSPEEHTATYLTDTRSVYSQEGNGFYFEEEQPPLPTGFPVPPPAAVVPTNNRFYSGDLAQVRPTTSGSTSPPSQAAGAIPTYSAMNKY